MYVLYICVWCVYICKQTKLHTHLLSPYTIHKTIFLESCWGVQLLQNVVDSKEWPLKREDFPKSLFYIGPEFILHMFCIVTYCMEISKLWKRRNIKRTAISRKRKSSLERKWHHQNPRHVTFFFWVNSEFQVERITTFPCWNVTIGKPGHLSLVAWILLGQCGQTGRSKDCRAHVKCEIGGQHIIF